MATSNKDMATSNKPGKSAAQQDAVEMLMADHKKVKKLFAEFQSLKEGGSAKEKASIVAKICQELTVHSALEEEIFYPAVRKAIDDADLMDEALVEHAGAKDLIAQLEEADAGEELYDAKVTVLGEQIEHHVKEEEGEMFSKAKRENLDTGALGEKMQKRKMALMAEMKMSDDDVQGMQPRQGSMPKASHR